MSPDPMFAAVIDRAASEEPFVDATREPSRTDQVWAKLGWAAIREAENQNMDLVPSYFDQQLGSGCPACGSAWQELLALGFTAPRLYVGETSWNGREFNVATPACDGLDLRAARVRCYSGHTVDFDSYTGCHRMYATSPTWLAVAGSVAMMALAGYYLAAMPLRRRRL